MLSLHSYEIPQPISIKRSKIFRCLAEDVNAASNSQFGRGKSQRSEALFQRDVRACWKLIWGKAGVQ